MKQTTIPITGMHCRSCEIMIGTNLEQLPGVTKAEVSLAKKSATIYSTKPLSGVDVRQAVDSAGYSIGTEKLPIVTRDTKIYKDLLLAVVIVVPILALLFLTGITDISVGSPMQDGVAIALIVGLTAGFSTCMALVGGLVLGLSARHAQMRPSATRMQRFRPHLFFNASRIIAFFVLGGLMGLVGSAFQLSGVTLGVLMIAVGVVMFVLGLQLTGVFPRLSTGGLTLPSGLARLLRIDTTNTAEYSHRNAATLGVVSFFLPCGFTQAMQLFAISTGSFMTGALIMGLFAIGTAPGLLGIGGLASVAKGGFMRTFTKVAGVAVVVFALINISNGYTLTGWQNQLSNIGSGVSGVFDRRNSTEVAPDATVLAATFRNDPSVLNPSLLGNIAPHTFEVLAGQSYALQVTAEDDGVGCMSTILIPGLVNNPTLLQAGKTYTLNFVAPSPGTYPITCAMGVPFGEIVVT